MLDFEEMQRRILQRHCDCGTCSPDDVPHQAVVEPIVMGLNDPSETLLLTPQERCHLAAMIVRQSQMLDLQSSAIDNLNELVEVNARLEHRVRNGIVGVAAFVAALTLLAIGHLL